MSCEIIYKERNPVDKIVITSEDTNGKPENSRLMTKIEFSASILDSRPRQVYFDVLCPRDEFNERRAHGYIDINAARELSKALTLLCEDIEGRR